MPTALELKLIHVAYRQAGLLEEHYRLILRNVAGVESSKLLSQVDFENVMATLEDSGFRHAGKPADYWRSVVARRGSWCGERQVHLIQELAKDQPYDLAGMCRRVSGERAARPDKLYPREASNLIEALKAIHRRQSLGGQTGEIPAAEAAGVPPGPRLGSGMASGASPAAEGV